MAEKNIINLENLNFDNIKFWAYFLSVSYPCAFLEEEECSMYDIVKEILPIDIEWSDEFTGYYDGILDEMDGYLENPATLITSLGKCDVLKIEFHPGDTIFYINETKIGCTGPHWEIWKLSYNQIKKLLYLENGAVLFQLLLPMVDLKLDEIADLKLILEKHFSYFGLTQLALSKITNCLISGIIKNTVTVQPSIKCEDF